MMDSDDDLMKLAATAARELQGDKNQKEPEPVNTDPNRLKCVIVGNLFGHVSFRFR